MPVIRAERAAGQLLEDCDVTSPPVPVEEIARRLGARLSFDNLGPDVSGLLYRDQKRTVIGVNASHAPTRQRFTIAHEIGHLRLHDGPPMFVDRTVRIDRRDRKASQGVDPKEIEANNFAAALLMPEAMILDAVHSPGHGRQESPDVVTRLAHRFDVSIQAMEYRLANLGLTMPSQ